MRALLGVKMYSDCLNPAKETLFYLHGANTLICWTSISYIPLFLLVIRSFVDKVGE